MKLRKKLRIGILLLVLFSAIYGAYKFHEFMSPPESRLEAGSFYKEMPPDARHIYINLPLDHVQPGKGSFTDFYILSPHFKKGGPVIFLLYDNQQEKVSPFSNDRNFDDFDEVIGKNMSYVIIGNRGVPPTVFPELFDTDGKTNLSKALQFYGSEQQIEDIEAVRKDMLQKGLLPTDGKIMLMGGSGGGFLVQQYLTKYGQNVSRAVIESSSAPDICSCNGLTFAQNFEESNKTGALLYDALYKNGKTDLGLDWLLFKTGLDGDTALQNSLLRKQSNWVNIQKLWKRISIPNNSFVIKKIFASPYTLEVRVRIWELIGSDLVQYQPKNAADHNLMYSSMIAFLPDFMEAYKNGMIPLPIHRINRAGYEGEVLILANKGDQDFGYSRAELISKEYKKVQLKVFDGQTHKIKKTSKQFKLLRAFFENGIRGLNAEG